MEAEVKVPPKEIRVWGKVAILTRARKGHKCVADEHPIEKGTDYYCVYIGCGGLYNLKFPDRVCVECINDYLTSGGK